MKLRLSILIALLALSGKSAIAQNPFDLPRRPAGPYEIHGQVIDKETKEPLSEVEISIQESAQPASPPFEIIRSEANGSFRFANLAEGKYTIRAERQGYAPEAYLQHGNFWTGIAVGADKDSSHIVFPLGLSATITGQVTDENGEAVRGASVTLWTDNIENGTHIVGQAQTVLTNDEGRYRLEHLHPGKYSVSMHAVPWYSRYAGQHTADGTYLPDVVYPTLYYPNARDWHGMEWINLGAGETGGADFHLVPEPSVHLRVNKDASIALLNDLPIGAGERLEYRSTDLGNGVLELSGIAEGRYQIQSQGNQSQEVDVSGSSEVHIDTVEEGGVSIHGSIQIEDHGTQLGNGLLQLKDASGHTYVAQFHGEWGDENQPAKSFVFQKAPAGHRIFELSVIQPPDLQLKKVEAKGAKISGSRIETEDGQQISLIVTVSQVSNAITGVAMKKGKPFPGAMILLMPEEGKDWERLVRRDQSDSDGTFRLAGIFPGKYLLLALEHGWELEWSKPEVLKPFLAKAMRQEIGERQIEPVKLNVQ